MVQQAQQTRDSDAIVARAIQWRHQLEQSSDPDATRRAVEQWCRADSAHLRVWQRLSEMDADFDCITHVLPGKGVSVLSQAATDQQRRRALKLLVGGTLLVGMPGVWWGWRQSPLSADLRASVGERREYVLDDGSRVILNTRSAADVSMGRTRRVTLLTGEMHVEVARLPLQPESSRLVARCHHGNCVADPLSRFNLREREGRSELSVEAGWVEASSGHDIRRIHAGERVALEPGGLRTLGRGAIDPDAWRRGQLIVSDIRLADLIEELARYRQGHIACDPAVASLRLSGVFRLASQDDILEHLTQLLPVTVVSRTRWWVTVVPRSTTVPG